MPFYGLIEPTLSDEDKNKHNSETLDQLRSAKNDLQKKAENPELSTAELTFNVALAPLGVGGFVGYQYGDKWLQKLTKSAESITEAPKGKSVLATTVAVAVLSVPEFLIGNHFDRKDKAKLANQETTYVDKLIKQRESQSASLTDTQSARL